MLVPIRPGVRGMGDAIDDALAGADGSAVVDSGTVDASSSLASTPSTVWSSSGSSMSPVSMTASSGGTVAQASVGSQILNAIFGPSKLMTSNLTAAQLAALKAQQGPSTALIIGGLAVGALVLGFAMRSRGSSPAP
jgi:hypothetical protein